MGTGASSADVSLSVEEARRSGVSDPEIREYCRVNKLSVPSELLDDPPVPTQDKNDYQRQLVAMGFHPDAACVALVNNDDLEGAIQWLCENPEAGIAAEKLSSSQPIPAASTNHKSKEVLIATAASILQRRRDHELKNDEVELVPWASAVNELHRREATSGKKYKRKKEFEQRWRELGEEYAERSEPKAPQAPWMSAIKEIRHPEAGESAGERELASLLRRADVANVDAKARREDAMAYCRTAVIGTTALEKVYLYLKDKVHNNEELSENDVRSTIFGSFGIEESAQDLVPKLLELILIEEDELLLKRLINRVFAAKKTNDEKQCAKQTATTVARTTDDAAAASAANGEVPSVDSNGDRPALVVDETALRAQLAAERNKARVALEGRLARRKKRVRADVEASGGDVDAAMRKSDEEAADAIRAFDDECATLRADQAAAEAAVRSKLAGERDRARAVLEERLRRLKETRRDELSGLPSAEIEAAMQEMDASAAQRLDAVEDHFDALVRTALNIGGYEDESCSDAARRLCSSSRDIEANLQANMISARDKAREDLRERLARRGAKVSDDELARMTGSFEALLEHASIGVKALVDCCGDAKCEADAEAGMRGAASSMLTRLTAHQTELERHFALERARKAAALQRRLEGRVGGKADAEWAAMDRESNVEELAATADVHARFCGAALGWSVAAGEPYDAAAIAALIDRHDDARRTLSDRLAASAASRRKALLDRLGETGASEDETRVALATLDRESHEHRWRELDSLVAEQRVAALEAVEVRTILSERQSAVGGATDLKQAYELLDGAEDELAAGMRAGLRHKAVAEVNPSGDDLVRASAAALIRRQAGEQIDVEDALLSERARQQAALRQRLRARCAAAQSISAEDELDDWAAVEEDMDTRELETLSKAHARFCGEAIGLVTPQADELEAVSQLVNDHESATRRLASEISADHARRRAALMAQVQKKTREKTTTQSIGDEIEAAFARLDGELRDDRRQRLRALIKKHQSAVLEALGTIVDKKEEYLKNSTSGRKPQADQAANLRDFFVSLCADETAAAEVRRKQEETNVQRQRDAIERRLAKRKRAKEAANLVGSASEPELNLFAETREGTTLVGRIEEARRRQLVTHQLHTKREKRLQIGTN